MKSRHNNLRGKPVKRNNFLNDEDPVEKRSSTFPPGQRVEFLRWGQNSVWNNGFSYPGISYGDKGTVIDVNWDGVMEVDWDTGSNVKIELNDKVRKI